MTARQVRTPVWALAVVLMLLAQACNAQVSGSGVAEKPRLLLFAFWRNDTLSRAVADSARAVLSRTDGRVSLIPARDISNTLEVTDDDGSQWNWADVREVGKLLRARQLIDIRATRRGDLIYILCIRGTLPRTDSDTIRLVGGSSVAAAGRAIASYILGHPAAAEKM